MPWGPIDNSDGKNITWSEPEHISAKIQIEKTQLLLTTTSEMTAKHQGEDHTFHQHILFCFEHISSHFLPESAKEKVLELSNLLSILLAHPLSINYVGIIAESGSRHELFFSTFKPIQRDSSSSGYWIRFFSQHRQIHKRWEIIFNCYFNSTYRKSSWVRLAGMQRYEGFWEYQTLGHVSLLDKYVDQYTEAHKKIHIPANTKAIKRLEGLLNKISPALQANHHQAVISAAKDAFSRERDLNFSEKYQHALSDSNPDVIKVVNISDADFKLIKEVRDKIAHGDAVDVPDGNFTRINAVVNKIILLMTYWFFLDIGLNYQDFLDCLDVTHNAIKLKAYINRTHLDRLKRPDVFISVTDSEFEKISKIKNIKISACFLKGKSGVIRYSKKYSDREKKWRFRKNSKSGLTPHSEIFRVDENRLTYLSPIHIECGEKILTIAHGWVIQDF